MDRTANAGTTYKWSAGSNPALSAPFEGPVAHATGPSPFPAVVEPPTRGHPPSGDDYVAIP